MKGGERASSFDEGFRVLRHQLEPKAPLSVKLLRDSYQFKLESNPEASMASIEKLESQPTASLNDIMEHVSQVDAMLNSKQPPRQVTVEPMDGKQREGGGGGSHDWCCYPCGEVGHSSCMCPNKENILAAWKEKNGAANKDTGKKEKKMEERRRGSHGGRKKCGSGGRGGGKQQSLRLAQTWGGENENAKVPKLQELSESGSENDLDNTGSGNGDGSDSLRINSLKLKLLLCQQ
jgi:hypothetical protein